MSEQHDYKFIEGDFSVEEAKMLLMSLINSKVNFHNLNSFSDYARFNKDIEKTNKRISELNVTQDEILKMMEEADVKGMKINIKSTISIELI